jgi:hypothetical protein
MMDYRKQAMLDFIEGHGDQIEHAFSIAAEVSESASQEQPPGSELATAFRDSAAALRRVAAEFSRLYENLPES